jgi:hypothetical protein
MPAALLRRHLSHARAAAFWCDFPQMPQRYQPRATAAYFNGSYRHSNVAFLHHALDSAHRVAVDFQAQLYPKRAEDQRQRRRAELF